MLAKVMLIGAVGSGKTSIIERFTDNTFRSSYTATIGADFLTKTLSLSSNTNVRIQTWDTSGQERFQNVSQPFYRESDAFVLTIDATKPFNTKEIQYWVQNTKTIVPNALFYVAINKYEDEVLHKDFKNPKDVKTNLKAIEGLNQLKDNAISFCSAKNNIKVHELFTQIANDYLLREKGANQILIDRLTEYTSFGNWFIAAIKWFFSFGIFSLGREKQKLAEALKKDLEDLADNSQFNTIISSYETKNRRLLSREYHSSWIFDHAYIVGSDYDGYETEVSEDSAYFRELGKKMRVNPETKGSESEYVHLNKGELGKILMACKTPSP